MSADNVIFVQKIKGKWCVWMDFASYEPNPINAKKFDTEEEAMIYARKFYDNEGIVEYGITPLKEKGGK